VTRRELLIAAVAACLLAVVMHWPLVLHLGEWIPRDLGDPLPQSWQVAWGGHALLEQPLDFFQANQFWPVDDSLAFGDALIGYAPAGLIGDGPHDAVVRYDLLFLFAYALAFLGAYLLARELGIGPPGSAVAGAAFAFAPFRLEQDGHMQVISSGGIPLSLMVGLRGIRLRKPGWLFAGWLIAAWQVSLGFALGLPLAYLLAGGTAAALVVWLLRGRPPLGRRDRTTDMSVLATGASGAIVVERQYSSRRLIIAGIVGALAFVAVAALIARPYLRVADENPEAKRPPSTVEAFSGPAAVFLTAPDENLIWGDVTAEIRDDLENVPEKTLFPGLLIVGLTLVGLGSSSLDRRLRIGLGVGVVAVSVLALGFQEDDGLLWPYRVVYEVLPGWEAIRTPGRLVTFSSLALALLAAAGAESLFRGLRGWLAARDRDVGPRGASLATGLLAAILVSAVVIEGRGAPFDPADHQDQPVVPDPPANTANLPAPQLHLPAQLADDNRRYLLWSADGFPDMVNGRASTIPNLTEDTIDAMDTFPDPQSVALLLQLGVRSVILHTERAPGTPQANAATTSIAGLPLVRRRLSGGLVVYLVRSPSAGSGVASDAGAPGVGPGSGSR
jgi:hypothetical protein